MYLIYRMIEYKPVKNVYGELVDKMPCSIDSNEMIRCYCGTRKNNIYAIKSFRKHVQSVNHKKWLEIENLIQKIGTLEKEMKYRYKENVKCGEELWYNEMFPDNGDNIPLVESTK